MRALLLLLLACPCSAAVSQGNDPLVRPGARLRWTVVDTVNRTTGDTRFISREGRLDSLSGRLLVLSPVPATQQEIDRGTVRAPTTGMIYAEAYTGFHRNTGHGAVAGLVVGAMAGFLLGGQGGSGAAGLCRETAGTLLCGTVPARPDERGVRAASFGAGVGVAGAIVGYLIRTEIWTEIDIAGLRKRLGLE